jgi:hypothetical protein
MIMPIRGQPAMLALRRKVASRFCRCRSAELGGDPVGLFREILRRRRTASKTHTR